MLCQPSCLPVPSTPPHVTDSPSFLLVLVISGFCISLAQSNSIPSLRFMNSIVLLIHEGSYIHEVHIYQDETKSVKRTQRDVWRYNYYLVRVVQYPKQLCLIDVSSRAFQFTVMSWET